MGLQGAAHVFGAGFKAGPQGGGVGVAAKVDLGYFIAQAFAAHQGRQVVCHAQFARAFGHRFQRAAHRALAQPRQRPDGLFCLGPGALQLRHFQLFHAGAVGHRQAAAQLFDVFNALQAALQLVADRRRPGRAQFAVQAPVLRQPVQRLGQLLLQLRRPDRGQPRRGLLVLRQQLHTGLQCRAQLFALLQGAKTPVFCGRLRQRAGQHR